jgi:phage major head subunit gpT-like protein
MIIDPTFLGSLESNMRVLFDQKYKALNEDAWWQVCTYQSTSRSLKEIVYFSLESAKLHRGYKGGFKDFDEIRYLNTAVENEYTQSGLELTEAELSDLDGNGVQSATKWIGEIGQLTAHHPQQMLSDAILSNPLTYDNLTYFNAAHYTNGVDVNDGVYANDFFGASPSGANPGKLPIDVSVTLDVAATNLTKAIATIKQLKTPTGYPRKLRVKALIVPPALYGRAVQLVMGAFLPGAAVSGGGTADNKPLAASWGIGQPIAADELSASFTGGSNTTYYLATEFVGEEAGFIYSNRQPFAVRYNSGMTDSELERADKLQWTCKGRNGLLPLHPYGLFRVQAT